MIETYKETQGKEGILFDMAGYKHPQEQDYNDDESSEDERNGDESSFNLRTLNLN